MRRGLEGRHFGYNLEEDLLDLRPQPLLGLCSAVHTLGCRQQRCDAVPERWVGRGFLQHPSAPLGAASNPGANDREVTDPTFFFLSFFFPFLFLIKGVDSVNN